MSREVARAAGRPRRLVGLLLAALPLAGAVQLAGERQDPEQEPAQAATELARQMEIVETGLRKLRRSVRDAERNAESLVVLAEVEQAALVCKREQPAMAQRVPEAEREAFVTAYRRQMIEVLEGLLAMEKALLDGDNAAAREHYKRVAAMEDTGHDRFTDDE